MQMATTWAALSAAGCIMAFTAGAGADITDPAMLITARNAQGRASMIITQSMGAWLGDTWSWRSSGDYDMYDPTTGEEIAIIRDLFCEMVADPQVTVNFTAVSGASDTTFSFSSGLLSFSNIDNSIAFATVGTTVTDNDANGAVLTGLYGGDAYRAAFNSGSVFDTLLQSYSVPIDSSLTMSDRSPAAGTTMIGTTFNMQADWSFTLSANDQVGGTSLFRIVPAPASAGLLGLAGLMASRRRR